MRVQRDFYARSPSDQRSFLEETWCAQCGDCDIGMDCPVEYEESGRVYIEGRCLGCHGSVRTEITEVIAPAAPPSAA